MHATHNTPTREATRLEIEAVRDFRRTRAHQQQLAAEMAQLQQQMAQVGVFRV
jgi:hypothetical protein